MNKEITIQEALEIAKKQREDMDKKYDEYNKAENRQFRSIEEELNDVVYELNYTYLPNKDKEIFIVEKYGAFFTYQSTGCESSILFSNICMWDSELDGIYDDKGNEVNVYKFVIDKFETMLKDIHEAIERGKCS